ncbi:MAG: type IV secretion system DNA-binding domain-containing protein [bacterium]|nr:type IV secretion system DNA-binding domain-containing protein [bacterium]
MALQHPLGPPNPITYFGQTDSRGRRTPFGIKERDRSRHMYVIGKTGMGKSTLLENMAIQDIKNGHGICFIDPHGKTADLLLDYVPENRIKDVLYFAPFDMDYPVSFNIMEDVGPDKRHLVVNGLMATFEKIWVDAWSARMAYILQNTLLALLEYPGSTLLGVNRMLVDKEYRKLVVANTTDPSVKSFWNDEFAKYTDRYAQEATPAIQNKVGQFTANPLIRNLVGQPNSTFDLRKMMDEKKIIIVNLSKGKVGEGNANLLGSMFITKIYLAAMSRADVSETELQKLPNFYLYVDEFQSFANKSFADILSEARKYKLNLTLAHQYIEQMEEEVRAAVFGNVGTMAVFRVGAFDAEFLEKEFAPALLAEDLVNLGIFQIYLKLMIDGVTSQPFSAVTIPPIERQPKSFRDEVIAASRETYARARSVVEQQITEWHVPIVPAPKERKEALPARASEAPPRTSPQREVSLPVVQPRAVAAEREPMRSAVSERRETPAPVAPRPPSVERPTIRTPETRPTPVSPTPTQTPISLSNLRAGIKKERPAGAHLSELRKALSDVLQQTVKIPAPAEATSSTPAPQADRQTSRPAPSSVPPRIDAQQSSTSSAQAREIPEDLLRKLLEVKQPAAKDNSQ